MEVEDIDALNVETVRQARENRKVPISLEDIAKSQKAQEEALQRPVFLSKEKRKRLREEAALERLAQTRKREAEARSGNNGVRPAPVQESAPVLSSAEIAAAEAEKKEIALIKSSYLGKKEKKKKRRTVASSRSKFMFEWDTCEDTSTDLNPLYNRKHDITLGFGRGFFAGSDRTQQRTLASRAYSELEQLRNGSMDGLKDPEIVQQRLEKQRKKDDELVMQARHWSDKSLEEMDTRDWRIFNEDFNISTRGTGIPHPLRNWDEAHFATGIRNALKEIGYKEPTPIQRAAIPIGLMNRDLMGIAETGSGKTCAFILPMLSYILKQPRMDSRRASEGPYAIILAPTRELAQQIDEEVNKFISRLGLRSVCVVGGAAMEQQTQRIREGAEIIIATPGRLNDCLRKRYLVLNQCNYIVLDEADRMLDMGFGDQVTDIFDAMPSSNLRPEDETLAMADQVYRQTFMFSATMPPEVERLAKKYLRNPAYVAIGDRTGKAVELIEQRVEFLTDNAKKGRLLKLLATSKPPIIVFMNQRTGCDAMARTLTQENYKVTVLHGGKVQDQRENSLEGFKSGRYEILVATDVAGRGIDVEGVTHVINYDAPKNIEIYMHRVGRTGRAGREGLATTFVTTADNELFPALRKVLMESGAKVPRELSQADRDMQRMITKF